MIVDILVGEHLRMTGARPEDGPYWDRVFEDGLYLRLVDSDTAFPHPGLAPSQGTATSFPFSFRTLSDGRLVGFGALHSVAWNNQAGRLALGIGRAEDRGKGLGREMLFLLLRYAFWELGLHRVSLDVVAYNTDAIRLYEAAGFRREGRLREDVYRDGKRYDRLFMGILRREWERRQG